MPHNHYVTPRRSARIANRTRGSSLSASSIYSAARHGWNLGRRLHRAMSTSSAGSARSNLSRRSTRSAASTVGSGRVSVKGSSGTITSRRSRVKKSGRKKYARGKGIGQFKYTELYEGTCTSSSGQQGSGDILAYGTLNQVALNTNGTTPGYGNSNTTWFAMNPNQNTTGSTLFGSQIAGSERIFCNGYNFQMKLTNMESVACELTLYFVTPKRSHNSTPITQWEAALQANSLGQAAAADPLPGTQFTAGGGGYPTRYHWNEKPFGLKTMRDNWKCLKKVSINLAGSSSENVNFSYTMDRMVKKDQVLTNATQWIPNTSIAVFYVIHGQVVIDKTGGGHLSTLATTEVAWVSRVTTSLTLLKSQVANVDVSRQFNRIPMKATLANQYMINADDQVDDINQA